MPDHAVQGADLDQVKITTALISVSDKSGIVDLAKELSSKGVTLLSTGGTARVLREANLNVVDVSEYTGFPEIQDGRVKTLHPKIHGGLLGVRGNATHEQQMRDHEIKSIDLVIANLYPFEKTVETGGSAAVVIENIDIGGPSMVRSSAKNHRAVAVLTSPQQYEKFLEEYKRLDGATTFSFRQSLASQAFTVTAQYDMAISTWFSKHI